MWYLVLYLTTNSPAIAVIPEKYPTEEACHNAASGESWKDRWNHSCIKAPTTTMCHQSVPNTNLVIPVLCEPKTYQDRLK